MLSLRCNRTERKKKHLHAEIDWDVYIRFKQKAESLGEKRLNRLIQGMMECYIHDTCDDCPYYQENEPRKKPDCKYAWGKVIEEK